MPERLLVTAQATGPARRETLWGREHLVLPAVLVREQVLNNNLGRTYLAAEDITDAWAEAWNGAPVVVDHPENRGQPTSARDPVVLNTRGAGHLFRTRAEDAALKADVFIDTSRSQHVDGLSAILGRLEKGDSVELSTGFPVALEETPGVFNGREYDKRIRPVGSDHLAIFADKVGACSVKDGCGLGVNECKCGSGDGSAAAPPEAENEKWYRKLFSEMLAEFRSKGGETGSDEASEEPVEAGDNQEEGTMNRDQMIAQLAEAGTDRDALGALSDDQLRVLCAAGGDAGGEDGDSEAWRVAHRYRAELERLKEETANAREMEEQERARLLDDVLYAKNSPWPEDEVRAMDIKELRKVHQALVRPQADYSGRGGPRAGDGTSFNFVKPILDGHRGESVLDKEEVA